MPGVCYPLSVLPGLSRLYLDYLDGNASSFYPIPPSGHAWMAASQPLPSDASPSKSTQTAALADIADILEAQNHAVHAGPAAIANIHALRSGARAVVTGQQVGLFGGPLYTLHKAATAVRLAQEASWSTGFPHVPIFWLATEDHDFAEIDHVSVPSGLIATGGPAITTGGPAIVRLAQHAGAHSGVPVGSLRLGDSVEQALHQLAEAIGSGPQLDLLRTCYRPEATFASAFAQWLAATFRAQGLIVLDAAGRATHALGSSVFRYAITHAAELEAALLERGKALEGRGYHQQVLVKPNASLLFLLSGEAENEPHRRQPLKRESSGYWTAGASRYSTDDLLAILDREPERLSPNALLRPVFQDAILPTAAYIGGPAEVAYFAQTGVLHQHILGRQTPVLPRLSATLLDSRQSVTLDHDGIDLPEVFHTPLSELTQRVGARNLPVEAKQKLHAAGSAMSQELQALTDYLSSLDPGLGRSAHAAANKMRYQMNRLRRLAANRELEKNSSIGRRLAALYAAVYPGGHLQERGIAAAAALARHGDELIPALVDAAGDACPGHKVIVL